ncbi:ComEA family DNA-binding protein [Agilicoccus flavus]|uniref:ComEA family DNA-binding protein n=1 Tax=Agilicoccus flavus TaxID=2775968 RepID=UPI001CF68AB2|nr:ComEA family DNA-binding protein [Agilicoccus flavus]
MPRPVTPDDRLAALLARADDDLDDDWSDEQSDAGDAWPGDDEAPTEAIPVTRPRGRGPGDGERAPTGGPPGEGDCPRLLTLPSGLQGARTRPARWAVVGLVSVLVLVAGGVGAWALWTRAGLGPQPGAAPTATAPGSVVSVPTRTAPPAGFGGSAAETGRVAGPSGSAAPAGAPPSAPAVAGGAGGSATAAGGPAYVHVVGAVRRPGVVSVGPSARVVDAVTKAGGPLPNADLATVNLARAVVDGEQVVVAVRGARAAGAAAAPPPAGGAAGAPSVPAGPAPGSADGGAGGGTRPPAAPVDLNTADLATLDTLPGVGPVLARRIVDWRSAHGRFTSVEQLGDVEGVGDKTLQELTPLVRV